MKIYNLLLLLMVIGLNISCTSSRLATYSNTYPQDVEKISRFAEVTELGIEKEAFIRIYGHPTTKDMFRGDNNELTEVLIYMENLDGNVLLKTGFTFEDNILKEQKTETEITYKKEFDNLQNQLNGVRHQILMK